MYDHKPFSVLSIERFLSGLQCLNLPIFFLLSSFSPPLLPPFTLRYKNNVCIDAKAHPEKFTVESSYNMHSLEIIK